MNKRERLPHQRLSATQLLKRHLNGVLQWAARTSLTLILPTLAEEGNATDVLHCAAVVFGALKRITYFLSVLIRVA